MLIKYFSLKAFAPLKARNIITSKIPLYPSLAPDIVLRSRHETPKQKFSSLSREPFLWCLFRSNSTRGTCMIHFRNSIHQRLRGRSAEGLEWKLGLRLTSHNDQSLHRSYTVRGQWTGGDDLTTGRPGPRDLNLLRCKRGWDMGGKWP